MKKTAKVFDIIAVALYAVGVIAVIILFIVGNSLIPNVIEYLKNSGAEIPADVPIETYAGIVLNTALASWLICELVGIGLAIPALITVFKGGSSKAPHIMMIVGGAIAGGIFGIAGGILGLVYLHNNESF